MKRRLASAAFWLADFLHSVVDHTIEAFALWCDNHSEQVMPDNPLLDAAAKQYRQAFVDQFEGKNAFLRETQT